MAADLRASRRLTLGISAGYNHARLTKDFAGPADTAGNPTFFARSGDTIGGPPLTLTASAEYHRPVLDDAELYGRADFQHLARGGRIDYTVFGIDTLSRRSDPFDQLSLRLGLRTHGLDVSVFADNVLNQAPILSYQRDSTLPGDDLFTATTLRPRTIGLTATHRY